MMELVSDPNAWLGLLTLTALEIVLGIDNIVFIAILTDRVPKSQRSLAYKLGLGGAMITRILLLLAISWVMGLTAELFRINFEWWPHIDQGFSGRDLILFVGGMFLIGKSVHEIYVKVEHEEDEEEEDNGKKKKGASSTLVGVVLQITVMDIIFSLDSVITAVGMVEHVTIMIAAIVVAICIMLIFAERVGNFVNRNPSMKILALSFLLLIGVLLTAEGFGQHVNKGYIYFAMGFALVVELLNMRFRRTHDSRKTEA